VASATASALFGVSEQRNESPSRPTATQSRVTQQVPVCWAPEGPVLASAIGTRSLRHGTRGQAHGDVSF
jgi:hypothetical protein